MAQYAPEQLGFLDEVSKDECTSFRNRGCSFKGIRCTACASGEIIERDTWAEPEPEACARFLCEFGLDFFLLGRAFEVPFFRRRGFIIKLHESVNKVGIGRNPNLGLYFSLFTRNAAYLIIFAKGCKLISDFDNRRY